MPNPQTTTFPQLSKLIKQWQFWVNFGPILGWFWFDFRSTFGSNMDRSFWTILEKKIVGEFGPILGPIMSKLLGRFGSDFENDFGDEFVLVWGQS
jgi:hypothetical protein